MIALIPPSALSQWGEIVIHRAIERIGAGVEIVRAEFGNARQRFEPVSGSQTICLSDYPPTALLGVLAERSIPVVCFAERPEASIRYVMAQTGVSLTDALRRYAAVSTAFPLLDGANALVIKDLCQGHSRATASSMLRHLGLGEASSLLPAENDTPDNIFDVAVPVQLSALSEAEAEIVRSVTHGLYAPLEGLSGIPIVWPRDVLSWGGHPEEPAPEFIDLAGPNRVLYHGPYFYLPPGQYLLKAHVGFSQEALGHPFAIELHGTGCIARADFSPNGSGWFHACLEFEHRQPNDRVEVHLTSMRGTIRGRVALNEVAFIRHGSPR